MIQLEQDGPWSVAEQPSLAGFQVEWADEEGLILSRRNQLFRTEGPGARVTPVGSFPAPGWKVGAARLRPLQRLLRFLVTNVVKLPDGRTFVSFDKSVGVLEGDRVQELAGLVRPCRILRSACALSEGSLYFGEYLSNEERGPMRIYRLAPGAERVEVAHTFAPGAVRHVHGIYRDPHTERLWCLTGDRGGECRVLFSEDGCRTFSTLGAADESWRAVSLLFTGDSIYYATDAEFQANSIYRVDRASGEREALGEIDGPVYYTRRSGDDLFFAVTAELCPSQVGRRATLWRLEKGGHPKPLVAFEKDRWPAGLFMVGTLHMPNGPGAADHFYLSGVALQGADARTYRVERRGVAGASH